MGIRSRRSIRSAFWLCRLTPTFCKYHYHAKLTFYCGGPGRMECPLSSCFAYPSHSVTFYNHPKLFVFILLESGATLSSFVEEELNKYLTKW